MRGRLIPVAIAAGCLLIGFAACKDNNVNQTSNVTNNFTSVGPEGGFATGPDGTRVDVPAGALNETVNMGIVEADAKEYPALPSGIAALGKIYAFHPHGQFFLIDATITMPAPNGDIDIYRAEPGGSWALFAKPKAGNGFVKFRTSTFSFYVATTGTGGCVRDLDCFTGQTCVSNACVTGGDAGTDAGGDAVADTTPIDTGTDATPTDASEDATPTDAGTDGPTCTRTPSTPGKTGTVTSPTSFVPKTDGAAIVRSGNDTGTFFDEIRVMIGDFTNICGYVEQNLDKASSKLVWVTLRRSSTTSAPPAFVPGVYTIETTTSSGVTQRVDVSIGSLGAACAPGSGVMPTGTVTITEVTATTVKGSFDVTGTGTPYSGTFDVPICNPTTTEPTCCVP